MFPSPGTAMAQPCFLPPHKNPCLSRTLRREKNNRAPNPSEPAAALTDQTPAPRLHRTRTPQNDRRSSRGAASRRHNVCRRPPAAHRDQYGSLPHSDTAHFPEAASLSAADTHGSAARLFRAQPASGVPERPAAYGPQESNSSRSADSSKYEFASILAADFP